jgi:hypothetical protein
MATVSTTPHAESAASMIGHINFDRNPAGKRSAGKPPATFDEAGTGNVAWLRYSGTRRRKSEQQRTQTSTYTGAPVLDPTYERPVASAGLLNQGADRLGLVDRWKRFSEANKPH